MIDYNRQGSLNNKHYFSQFRRLEVQNQGARMVGFLVKTLFPVYRRLTFFSLYLRGGGEGDLVPISSYKDTKPIFRRASPA